MEALYLLVPMSVLVVFFTIWLFFNASDGGQFDDLVGPALRILQDDDSTVVAIASDMDASDIDAWDIDASDIKVSDVAKKTSPMAS